jgi:glycosyltransferase 2 family protein
LQPNTDILKKFNTSKIILPILIGLGVAVFMIASNYKKDDFEHFKNANLGWILAAIFVIIVRDFGYVFRIRELTGRQLSWRDSLDVIILWEFASAVSPSAVGGTAFATFILMMEGIHFGRALAFVMLTAVLDNCFFLIASPIALLISGGAIFPPNDTALGTGITATFITSYSVIAIYTVVMAYALLWKPRAFKWILLRLTSIGFLNKWREQANRQGTEIILASAEIRTQNQNFWIIAIVSTLFVWSARYFMTNCMLASFTTFPDGLEIGQHLLIFGRQVVYWVLLLIAITPGGSGIAEYGFPYFFGEFTGNFNPATSAVLWRLFTYYPYLILGAIFLPRWIRKVYSRKS